MGGIKSLGMLQELLRKDKVRNTRWFRSSSVTANGYRKSGGEAGEKASALRRPGDDVHITFR